MTDQQADDLIAEAKKWLESAGHNGGPPARLLAALAERVTRQPQEPALVTYMTATTREARSAAFLRTYAERIRNGTAASWEIPNTVASTLEDIANLLAASVSHRQEPPQEPALRQALKEIRYICRDVELGNWFAPDAIEHIIVACESVDDQPAAEGSQPVLRRDPCGCLHDGSRIVEWCTRSGQTHEGHEEEPPHPSLDSQTP